MTGRNVEIPPPPHFQSGGFVCPPCTAWLMSCNSDGLLRVLPLQQFRRLHLLARKCLFVALNVRAAEAQCFNLHAAVATPRRNCLLLQIKVTCMGQNSGLP